MATSADFLIHFAQTHETFRRAELDSIAALHAIPVVWKDYRDASPYSVVSLPSIAAARKLVARSILVKNIYSLWGCGASYDELHTSLQSRMPALAAPAMGRSFAFDVESFYHKRTSRSRRDLIESFSYLGFDGPTDLKTPEMSFCIFEEYVRSLVPLPRTANPAPIRVFLGQWVGGSSRDVVDVYDLKKRRYIGTTSMEAELSLVTANMAQAAPGRVFFDPFVGTGSFAVACAHFGAHALGADIDGRQIRGRKPGHSLKSNFEQYKTQSHFLDCIISDLTNSPIRNARFLDGILCDPPYGVREGLKVLGSKDQTKPKEPVVMNGILRHTQDDYVPPKRPYSFEAMLDDIMEFAAEHLVDGGRLCFWMPCANDEDLLEVPLHPQMKLESDCVQEFNKWSRRLLTYSRRHGDQGEIEAREYKQQREHKKAQGFTADELNKFRKKYFEGFRTPDTGVSEERVDR